MITPVYNDDYRNTFIEWKSSFHDIMKISAELKEETINALKQIDTSARLIMQFRDQFDENSLKDFMSWINSIIEIIQQYVKVDNRMTGGYDRFHGKILSSATNLNALFSTMMPKISQLIDITEQSTKKKEIDDLHEKAIKEGAEITILSDSLSKTIELFKEEYNPLLARLSFADYREDFSTIAKADKKSSVNWLMASIGAILITLLAVYCFFSTSTDYTQINAALANKTEDSFPNSSQVLFYLEVFKAVFYRVFFISLGIFIIKVCINKYKTTQHNFTVNTHKANSLKAALTFMDKTSDTRIHDKIILHAANAIFSHQPTGYNDKTPENLGIGEKAIDKLIERTS